MRTYNARLYSGFVFLLLLCAGPGNAVFAQTARTFQSRLSGANGQLVAGAFTTLSDISFFDAATRAKMLADYPVKNSVTLMLDEASNRYLQDSFTVTARIRIITKDVSGVADSLEKQLQISYSRTGRYQALSSFIARNKHEVTVRVLSVVSSVTWDVMPVILLENRMDVQPQFTFSCDNDKIETLSYNATIAAGADELAVSWPGVTGMDAYDLEWCYTDTSALSRKKTNNVYNPALIFTNNASRVTITGTAYKIPLLYDGDGMLFFRVRPVQLKAGGGRLEGKWSSDFSTGLGATAFTGHERALNWQASTSFAEEGKRKSVVQYFDGSLRNRQTVTKDNTTDTTVIGESFYDYQGRAVIQVLPTPSLNNVLKYTHNFNVGLNGAEYDKDKYDLVVAAGTYCNTIGQPMSSQSGSSKYYSPQNPNKEIGINRFIPDAELYPFTQTEYTNDNTGAVSRQGGVGPGYQLNSGHETKYYYGGAPDKNDLYALFGTDVGDASHYVKNLVRDANGQYSVSYLDMHGRTIATALAGNVPDSIKLQALTSSKDTLQVETIEGNVTKGLVMESQKYLVVTKPDNYEFDYTLDPEQLKLESCAPGTRICYDCLYDLEIRITDDCNNQKLGRVFDTVFHNFSLANNPTLHADSVAGAGKFRVHFVLPSLPEGGYLVTKRLSVSRYAVDYYRDSVYLKKNTCKTLDQVIQEQRELLAKANCFPTCAECKANLGDAIVFRNNYLLKMGIVSRISEIDSLDPASYNADVQLAWNTAMADCNELCGETTDYDKLRSSMLMDMSPPSGQYANITDTQDPYSIFYQDFTNKNSYPVYTNSAISYKNEDGTASNIYDDVTKAMLLPQQLDKEAFSAKFAASWAEALLPYHPEYCKLQEYEKFKASLLWDKKFQETDTYADALSSGYLNPIGYTTVPYGTKFTIVEANKDPLYTFTALQSKLRNGLLEYAKEGNKAVSMWSVATMSAVCGDPITDACKTTYQDVNNAFNAAMCDGDKDMAWRTFRELYLRLKKDIIQTQIASVSCTGQPGRDKLLQYNHTLNFNTAAQAAQESGIAGQLNINNPSQTQSTIKDSIAKSYNNNCRAYAAMWLKQLAPCTNYDGVRNEMIEELVKVCVRGADANHPNGSRDVSPDSISISVYKSFNEVVEAFNTRLGITANTNCNAEVLTNPLPYNQQQGYNKPVYSKPSDCECERIRYWKTRFLAAKMRNETFSGFLARVAGTAISDSELATLEGMCNSSASCTYVSKPVTLPPALQCFTGEVCADCIAIDTLYAKYKAAYPLYLPGLAVDSTGTMDSLQEASNGLFEKYMNNHLGFRKQTWEYLQFMDSCKRMGSYYNQVCKPFYRSYNKGGINGSGIVSMVKTSDNGYVMAGYYNNDGSNDAYMQRVDSTGKLLWAKRYGGIRVEQFNRVIKAIDSGYIAIGQTNTYSPAKNEVFLVRVSEKGDVVWCRTYSASPGTATGEVGRDIAIVDSGYVFVGGYNYPGSTPNHLFGRVGKDGSLKWIKQYGFNTSCDAGRLLKHGDTLVAAVNYYNGYDIGIYKSTQPGVFDSLRLIDIDNMYNWPVCIDRVKGGYRITSISAMGWAITDTNRVVVFTLSDSNTITSYKKFNRLPGGPGGKAASGIAETPLKDGGYLLVQSDLVSAKALYITRVSAANVTLWTNRVKLPADLVSTDVKQEPDGSFTVAGNTGSLPERAVYIRLDSLGRSGCFDSSLVLGEGSANISVFPRGFIPTVAGTDLSATEFRNRPITATAVQEPEDSMLCASNCVSGNIYIGPVLCGRAAWALDTIVNEQLSECADSGYYAINKGTVLYQMEQERLKGEFESSYLAKCLQASQYESFTVKHGVNEFHYTLYYYDQAGNLVKTVAPREVHPNRTPSWLNEVDAMVKSGTGTQTPPHGVGTEYRYNTLQQVVNQNSPDGGNSMFWYDRLGRLVVSQNAQQHEDGKSSYTLYDQLGRITEVGQIASEEAMRDSRSRNADSLQQWLTGAAATKEQITATVYDIPYGTGVLDTVLMPKNLRNRVAWSAVFADNAGLLSKNYTAATHYSYDIHGNVDTLVQDYREGVMNDNIGNRWKKIVYQYDLISGKINFVAYQPQLWAHDAFYHRYQYDAENRLTNVETSRDSIHWSNDVFYSYYKHGPLARMELGNKVQGIDYVYTLQGWIKAVNPVVLQTGEITGCAAGTAVANLVVNARPINGPALYTATGTITFEDGFDSNGEATEGKIDNTLATCNNVPAAAVNNDGAGSTGASEDAFRYVLQYNNTDFKGISAANPAALVAAQLSSNNRPLYNGSISGMGVNVGKLNSPMWYSYRYDQLNRLVNMDAYRGGSLTWGSLQATLDYHEGIEYDPNGNILSYQRNADSAAGRDRVMDVLTYKYAVNKNQLDHIEDQIPVTKYTEDIDGQDTMYYTYDKIGNLTREGGDTIIWNVYGKIKRIGKKAGGSIEYTYDASGNRISKAVGKETTWYVRDAQGNVLSVYQSGSADNKGHLSRIEVNLYGRSRLGVLGESADVTETASTEIEAKNDYFRGSKLFELNNHLGNVLATVSDRKVQVGTGNILSYYTADVVSAQDYYPFGLLQPGRGFNAGGYRYGFNGQEKSSEIHENTYTAEFWEYDARIGRRWNLDPKPIGGLSQYSVFMNNPVLYTDGQGDTTMFYDMEGNYMETVNNAGSLNRIKIDRKIYDGYKSGGVSALVGNTSFGESADSRNVDNDQILANAFVNGVIEAAHEKERTLNSKLVSFQTGILNITVIGDAISPSGIIPVEQYLRNKKKNTKEFQKMSDAAGLGTLNINAEFDDGSSVAIQSYRVSTGPWYYGPIPNGGYMATKIEKTRESGMYIPDLGIGFKVHLTNSAAYNRDGLRIHPDLNNDGTAGCIGLYKCSGTQLQAFYNTVKGYLNSHRSIQTSVNFRGNPNYSRPVGQNSGHGQ